jgi:DNA adenine methylase
MKAILRYLGGKNRYAREIIDHFPLHFCYNEPCGGSAGVLLNKAPSPVEIYNDLDGEVVNFFRVLRYGNSRKLIDAIRLTPYSREELNNAQPVKDPVERARRFLVRSWFGIANDASRDASSGFRVSRNRQPTVAADWKNLPETLEKAVERLRNVYIEQRDALELIKLHDGPETLHFIDPPYLKRTRTREGSYTHEFTDKQHEDLLRLLRDCRGKVVLCGYDNELYNNTLAGWSKVSYGGRAGMGKKRVECLWMNYPDQLSLFKFNAL